MRTARDSKRKIGVTWLHNLYGGICPSQRGENCAPKK
jgi:hypothetical protein